MVSFKGLSSSSAAASAVGKANQRTNTTPELLLKRALRARGVSGDRGSDKLPGKPDIVLNSRRIAIFVDGDFWHGRHWAKRKRRLAVGSNADYWVSKISRNKQRDRQVNAALRSIGWRVVRLWESDIRRDPGTATEKLLGIINKHADSDG
jgi:DNA mismatch endonuclease (patch repair protein)